MFNTCSPYLKLLTGKGIDWNASLTEELVERAIKEDKLIFQHIGYVSNMYIREESVKLFSDPKIIKVLNDNFICIAEDKEDKPESFLLALDLLFLNQDFSYGPMNMFIMPNRKPIICFSDCEIGHFMDLTNSIILAKKEKKELLIKLSEELSKRAVNTGIITEKRCEAALDSALLSKYVQMWYKSTFENDFISKLKPFTPNPSSILTIIEYLKYFPNETISLKVECMLDHLQSSAIFDPVDGGFFRQAKDYSCQEAQYEKTLEENSQFMMLYTTAYKYFNKESYRKTAILTYEFVKNELSNKKGGYYNSSTLMTPVDDSSYYLFSINELSILFPERYADITIALGLDITKNKLKKQVPVRRVDYFDIITEEERALLRTRRDEHRGYYIDKREITSHNSQFIKALTMSSKLLDNDQMYLEAVDGLDYLLVNNRNNLGKLYRYTCCQQRTLLGYLSDYSNFIDASLELFKAKGNREYLNTALKYLDIVMENFYKPENGMFSKSEKNLRVETIPFKRESIIDVIRPSANSIMTGNLLSFYEITGNEEYLKIAEQQINNIIPNLLSSGPMLSSWAHKILKFINLNISRSE
ncbi:MAG: DUF255 domain-containing protein [Bacteroidales bacterium]